MDASLLEMLLDFTPLVVLEISELPDFNKDIVSIGRPKRSQDPPRSIHRLGMIRTIPADI
jgi:hypothetical protein